MTKIELLELINKKCKILTEEVSTENPEFEFFTRFPKKDYSKRIEKLTEINLEDLFIAYIRSINQNFSYEELQEAIYFNRAVTESLSSRAIDAYYELICEVYENKKCDEILVAIKDKNIKQGDILLKKIFDTSDNFETKLINSLRLLESNEETKISYLIELYKKDPSTIDTVFALLYALKFLEEKYTVGTEIVDLLFSDIARKKDRNIMIEEGVKEQIKYAKILEELKKIEKYRGNLLHTVNSKKRASRKQINAYNEFTTKFLSETKKGEIKNYKQLIEKISDETVRLEILKYIYEHNIRWYQQLENRYNHLEKNSKTKYKALLEKYNISSELDDYYMEIIMENSYEDVAEILECLSNVNLTDKETVITALQARDKERVKELCSLCNKNYITLQLLTNNKELFSKTSTVYDTLIENINYLEERKINVLNFSLNCEVLLIEEEQFSKNIDIMCEYNLVSKISIDVIPNFLGNKSLEKIIDTILEFGFESYLLEDLNILNYDITRWNRMKVLKELDIPITSKEELEKVLTTTDFIVPDEKIDEYIYNAVSKNKILKSNQSVKDSQNLVERLNQFNNSSRTYKINGVIFSKNKVKRNLASIENDSIQVAERFILALTAGSTLNDREYQEISSTIVKKLTK